MLRFVHEDVVWQEVPHEVSLAYTIAGCPLRCPGCHSADTWNARQGRTLSPAYLQQHHPQLPDCRFDAVCIDGAQITWLKGIF